MSTLPANNKVSLNKETGLLEVYDSTTGKLLAVQESPYAIDTTSHKMVERVLPDGSVIKVEATINPLLLTSFSFKEYSTYVVDLICQKITEGEPLTSVCTGKNGFPTYSEFCRWRRLDPSIRERIEEARRDRAECLRDMAYSEALAIEEDTSTSDKARFDALMKLAAVDDREKYGNAKAEVAVTAPIQILIKTGIDRGEA